MLARRGELVVLSSDQPMEVHRQERWSSQRGIPYFCFSLLTGTIIISDTSVSLVSCFLMLHTMIKL
jgi:hypothetical protein